MVDDQWQGEWVKTKKSGDSMEELAGKLVPGTGGLAGKLVPGTGGK